MPSPPLQPDGCKGYLTSNYRNLKLTALTLGDTRERIEPPLKHRGQRQTRLPRLLMWKTAPIPQSPIPPPVAVRSLGEAARPRRARAERHQAAEGRARASRGSARALTSAPTAIGQGTLRSLARGARGATPMATTQRHVLGATSASPSAAKRFVETAVPPTRTLCCAHSSSG